MKNKTKTTKRNFLTLAILLTSIIHIAQAQTPLINAVRHLGLKGVKEIINNSLAEILNKTDALGRTALMWAISLKHPSIVKFLLNQPNINKNIVDNNGRSAILSAVETGQENIFNMLLEGSKINPNVQDTLSGSTPLIAATKKNQYEMMKKLLKIGAKVNTQDFEGKTALDYATTYESQKILGKMPPSGFVARPTNRS